jgi:predicted RNase H-like HicB family nuclease
MLYPVYVHKDPESAYGVTFPDFPGCFSAADELDEIPRLAQEAVEVHFEGEDVEIPSPTAIEELAADSTYEGGLWLLIDIDLSEFLAKAAQQAMGNRT